MRWDDVDLEEAVWHLKADSTKAHRAHLVPLSTPMVALLNGLPRFGEYVFTSDGETHVGCFTKVKSKLDAFIAKDGGNPIGGWVLHDLRRTAATHMVRLGVLEEVVGKVLNHASTGVTGRHYNIHSYLPEKRSALDRWAAEVMRSVEGGVDKKVVSIRG